MTSGTAVYQSFHRSVSGRDSTIAEVLQPRFLALAAGYVLSAVALLHAHSVGFMGLFIPSILFATWFVNGRWRFSAVIVWSVLNLMVVAVFIPWLALLAEIASANTGYFWLKPIGVRNALAIFSHVLLDKHYPGSIETGTPIALTLSEMTLAASLVIAGCARAMHGDWRRRGIVIAFVLLPVIFFAVSQVKPVFWEYILMSFALPLLALLAGFALEAPVLGRVGQAAMIAGLMLFQLPAERVVYAGEPEPWNDVAAYLASNTAAGEPILFWPPHAEWSVRFYWKSDISRWRTVNLGPHLEFAPLRTVPSLPVTAVPEFVHDAERVWLVTDEKAVPSDDDLPALRTTLLKRLHLVTRQNFEGGLTVFGYANRRRD